MLKSCGSARALPLILMFSDFESASDMQVIISKIYECKYSLYCTCAVTGFEDNLSETLSPISLALILSTVSGIWNRIKCLKLMNERCLVMNGGRKGAKCL